MVYGNIKLRKLCFIIVCLISLIFLIVFIYINRPDVDVNTLCLSTKREGNRTIKYIFDLYKWQAIMQHELKMINRNETLWCDVPVELKFLSDGICRRYDINDCTRLPCRLIYSSVKTLEEIKCSHQGHKTRTNDSLFEQHQGYYECKIGYSLDLFSKTFQQHSNPSLIADPYVRFSDDLYVNVLNNHYRSCTSIWGFYFRYESIVYYPWTGDPNKLKLFDITFGYDRSIHDFIPTSHLFGYVEQLKVTSKRITTQQAMNSKKSFVSATKSDVYWPSQSVVSELSRKNIT